MSHAPLQQGTQNPPIPALPARPGAATGTQAPATGVGPSGNVIAGSSADEARAAIDGARQVIRDAVRTSIQTSGPQGTPVVGVPPSGNLFEIPPDAFALVGMTLGLLLAMIIGFPIARAIGRVIERRGDAGIVRASDVAPQLKQLQSSVDTMAIELERISEAQRYSAKLLSERGTAPPGGDARAG